MAVMMVLLILIGVMATVVQSSYHGQKQSQIGTQAYYTARSVNERVTDWLEGTSNNDVGIETTPHRFIDDLKGSENGIIEQTYTEEKLDPSGEGKMGHADVVVSINKDDPDMDRQNTLITVKVTGYFAGDSETIVSTLRAKTNNTHTRQNVSMMAYGVKEIKPFDPDAAYGQAENDLNALPRDGSPLIVGNEDPETKATLIGDYNNNKNDQEKVDTTIQNATNAYQNREVTFMNFYRSSFTPTYGYDYNTVIGTLRYLGGTTEGTDTNSAGKEDVRRFVTPKNGRWLINPLQTGGKSTTSDHKDDATAAENSRIIMLAMGDFHHAENGDVSIRLGGISGGAGKNNAYPYNDPAYYNSLIGLDVVDNAGVTVAAIDDPRVTPGPGVTYDPNAKYIDYYEGGIPNGIDRWWHPQKWNSMTIYTQKTDDNVANGGVNTRLVFGPFAHKTMYSDSLYSSMIDYWNFGQHVANPWYGQHQNDMNLAFPGNDDNSSKSKVRRGMAYIPQYYGNNFRMFFLDDVKGNLNLPDNSDNNVLIIQGVNILGTEDQHSVVYSRRGLELGGGLVMTETQADSHGATERHVNSNIDGMNYGTASKHANYFAITTRYSQIIYNTDIVLRTPNGASTPRSSHIYDASLPYDGVYNEDDKISDKTNKWFNPTIRIIGGYMFVGAGQTLQIDGGRNNTNPTWGDKTQTMIVSPSSLTVENGGVVNIGKPVYRAYKKTTDAYTESPYANVTTDMYVGGKVNLTTGAYASGSAVVGNGDVNAPATFSLADKARFIGDIHITRGGVLTLGASSRYTGNVVVGDGGVMTIGNLASCVGNIYVESGGALTTSGQCTILGDIQIANGGKITLGAGALIEGDVRCAGEISITGDITVNYRLNPGNTADNPLTDEVDESESVNGIYSYHGIFVYSDPETGEGELTLSTPAPKITVNSGKIHIFAGSPSISHGGGYDTFCDPRSSTNVCRHWTSTSGTWQKQGDSSNG
jgi:hypothetical protein